MHTRRLTIRHAEYFCSKGCSCVCVFLKLRGPDPGPARRSYHFDTTACRAPWALRSDPAWGLARRHRAPPSARSNVLDSCVSGSARCCVFVRWVSGG